MRGDQFDRIMVTLKAMDKTMSILVDEFTKVRQRLEKLEGKTMFVSNVDKEIERMKLDIKALIDEKEES